MIFFVLSPTKEKRIVVSPHILTQAANSQAIVHSSVRQAITPLHSHSISTTNINISPYLNIAQLSSGDISHLVQFNFHLTLHLLIKLPQIPLLVKNVTIKVLN